MTRAIDAALSSARIRRSLDLLSPDVQSEAVAPKDLLDRRRTVSFRAFARGVPRLQRSTVELRVEVFRHVCFLRSAPCSGARPSFVP